MPATAKTLVVKQGTPSASGEVVDTSTAKVIPPSSEVKSEAAAREVAEQRKATQAKVGAAVKKMTGGAKKPAAKAKAAAKPRGTGNNSGTAARLTMEWTGKDKKDVAVKDRVRTAEGIVIDVIGRWTRKTKDGALVPMVTGRIVFLPAGATVAAGDTKKSDTKGRSKGDRQNAVAAGCTHVKS
jgi:hypothetical protein